MKILIVADRRNWALGSIARAIASGLSAHAIDILYFRELSEFKPILSAIFDGDYQIVHFLNRFNLTEVDCHLGGGNDLLDRKCHLTFSVPDFLGLAGPKKAESERLLSYVDGIVFSSSQIQTAWSQSFAPACPTTCIFDLFTAFYPTIKARWEAIEAKSENEFVISWVGNSEWYGGYCDHKGFHRIWSVIKEQADKSDIKIKEFDSANGFVRHSDVLQGLSNSHVLCVTSTSEGTSLPVLEAIGAGCAVLSSRTGVLFSETRTIFPDSFCRRHASDYLNKLKLLRSDRRRWEWHAKAQSVLANEAWNLNALNQWGRFFVSIGDKSKNTLPVQLPNRSSGSDYLKSVLCLTTSKWPGVMNSSRAVFPIRYEMPSPSRSPEAFVQQNSYQQHIANEYPIVISGGDNTHRDFYARFLRPLKNSSSQVSVLWHGSLTQLAMDGHQTDFEFWYDAAKKGEIFGIAALKRDMYEFLVANGISAFHMENTLALDEAVFCTTRSMATPSLPKQITVGFPSSGTDYNKNIATQLASLSFVSGHVCQPLLTRSLVAERLCKFLGLTNPLWIPPTIHQSEFITRHEEADINCSVTFSECSPMVPIESAMNLTPCIVGPASDIYKGFARLQQLCVVSRPDDAVEIGGKINRVAENYSEIVHELKLWRSAHQRARDIHCRAYYKWLFGWP